MKPFDDILPEEQEPQHEELITFLQRVYSRPVMVPPAEQAQIIARVRERLVQADQWSSLDGDISLPQIGVLDSSPHQAISPAGKPRRDKRRFRLMALLAAAVIIAVLLGTPLLLSRPWLLSTGDYNHTNNTQGGLPTLTLSPNVATIGTTTIRLALKNFTPSTSIALTHDIQEPMAIVGGSSIIRVDPAGSANVAVHIDSDWETGFHLIVAEDLTTRHTASATLLITGRGPTPPPHLQLATTPLDLGAAVVGANTIRPFKLLNSGGGSIMWSASSKQAWLLVSPSQGTFSAGQTISIAVQRVGLKPADYKGDLAISSNISPIQHVEVDMSVLPLPPGPVLALSPALLSFSTNDGQPTPSTQTLTISNPGTRPFSWSLANQNQAIGPAGNWLSASPLSGVVAPGATAAIQVSVSSQSILPGAYTGTLLFTAPGAIDSSQAVNVSLTVLPHCGIVTNSGILSFTAVQGQNNLGTQALSLNATVSCAGAAIAWKLAGTPSWVAVTPASGQLKGTTSAVVSVSVNTAGLSPNTYYGQLSFVAGMSTQTVVVMLVVQPPPSPAEPVMGVSPLSLNFSNTQGLPNPTGQVVTITNNGGSPLKWSTSITLYGNSWLGAVPTGGTIAPGQTGQVTINVTTSKLTPGTYTSQFALNGLDASGNLAPGSPQTVTVNLVIQPPCAITQPSASARSFSAVQGAANPTPQTVMFMGVGACTWPVTWSTKVSSVANWLTVTKTNSIMGTGQAGSIAVAVTIAGLSAGTYQTTVSISATDASGAPAQGSPQQFMVTLTVTGFTVSGSVVVCSGPAPACTTSQPLPGATVTLMSGTTTVATATADAAGNYFFANVALGSYTLSASGTDSTGTHTGSAPVTVQGNTTGVIIQTF